MKLCPVCRYQCADDAQICQMCGFDEMDSIFLSDDDYKEWKSRILVPAVRKNRPRVFAGRRHWLILMPDGRLYGFGSNESNAVSDHSDIECYKTPVPIAENIRTAAAGVDYTAMIGFDGIPALKGSDTGKISERFFCDCPCTKVYASLDDNSFIVSDAEDKYLFFGKNLMHLNSSNKEVWIVPRTEKAVIQDPPITFVYTERKNNQEYYSDNSAVGSDFKDMLDRDRRYLELLEEYGCENLKYEIPDELNEIVYDGFEFADESFRTRRCTLRLYTVNNMIYSPAELFGCSINESIHNWGLPRMYFNEDYRDINSDKSMKCMSEIVDNKTVNSWIFDDWKYNEYDDSAEINREFCAVLDEDNTLKIYLIYKPGYQRFIIDEYSVLENVIACDINNYSFIFVNESGEVFYGLTDVLMERKIDFSCFSKTRLPKQ